MTAQITIISRRDHQRSGMRMTDRGIDKSGHTANFVETELVVSRVDGERFTSFVTVRGSAPLFWEDQQGMFGSKPKVS